MKLLIAESREQARAEGYDVHDPTWIVVTPDTKVLDSRHRGLVRDYTGVTVVGQPQLTPIQAHVLTSGLRGSRREAVGEKVWACVAEEGWEQ